MTTRYQVGYSLKFMTADSATVNLEDVLSRFYEELLGLEDQHQDMVDPDIAASLADFTCDVDMVIEAGSVLDAQVKAAVYLRTALHTIEVGTPGWEAVIASLAKPKMLQDA